MFQALSRPADHFGPNLYMSPEPESLAPELPSSASALLTSYTHFLAALADLYESRRVYRCARTDDAPEMATFDPCDPASPVAYSTSGTALMLLDFQGYVVHSCGPQGQSALANAQAMKDWALSNDVMVIHSVVDVSKTPRSTCKGAERISKILSSIADDRDAAEEPTEIAFSKSDNEYVVLKDPGVASALKSTGIMELLAEHDVQSLVICGLSTSGAVLRTAMAATDEGFVVTVIHDACADPAEGLHETLVRNILPSRAHVATSERFIAEWAKLEG